MSEGKAQSHSVLGESVHVYTWWKYCVDEAQVQILLNYGERMKYCAVSKNLRVLVFSPFFVPTLPSVP